MAMLGPWYVEDSAPAPESGAIATGISGFGAPVSSGPANAIRVGGNIWPNVVPDTLPPQWFAAAFQTITLSQVAIAQEPTSGAPPPKAIQTLDFSQVASGRRGVYGAAAQTIGLTQAATGYLRVKSTAVQPITLTQIATASGASTAMAVQTIVLSQLASGRANAVRTALQTITLTQVANGRRRTRGVALQTLTLSQQASGTTTPANLRAIQTIALSQVAIAQEATGQPRALQTITLTQVANATARLYALAIQTIPLSQVARSAASDIEAVAIPRSPDVRVLQSAVRFSSPGVIVL
jgi:hypothetical protein